MPARAILLLVTLLTAGCASAPAPAPRPGSADSPPRLLALPAVEYVGGNFPMPTSEARTHVPEGYTPTPYRGVEGMSIERLMALAHEEIVIDGDRVASQATILRGFFVTPPDPVEGVDGHFFLTDLHTDSPRVAETLRAWSGRALEADDVAISTSATGPARAAEARFGAARLSLAAGAPPATSPGFPVRVHVLGDDGVLRAIDLLIGPYTYIDGAARLEGDAASPRSGTGAYASGDAYDWTFVPVDSPTAPATKWDRRGAYATTNL